MNNSPDLRAVLFNPSLGAAGIAETWLCDKAGDALLIGDTVFGLFLCNRLRGLGWRNTCSGQK